MKVERCRIFFEIFMMYLSFLLEWETSHGDDDQELNKRRVRSISCSVLNNSTWNWHDSEVRNIPESHRKSKKCITQLQEFPYPNLLASAEVTSHFWIIRLVLENGIPCKRPKVIKLWTFWMKWETKPSTRDEERKKRRKTSMSKEDICYMFWPPVGILICWA